MTTMSRVNPYDVPSIDPLGANRVPKSSARITDEERLSVMTCLGCPISKGHITKMTKPSFRKMCLKYQTAAGIKSRADTTSHSNTTRNNCSSSIYDTNANSRYVCPGCKIGIAVRQNKNFEAPDKVEFTVFEYTDNSTTKKRRKVNTQRLYQEEVRTIREMHSNGSTITQLASTYKVANSTISNIVNRVTWKDV